MVPVTLSYLAIRQGAIIYIDPDNPMNLQHQIPQKFVAGIIPVRFRPACNCLPATLGSASLQDRFPGFSLGNASRTLSNENCSAALWARNRGNNQRQYIATRKTNGLTMRCKFQGPGKPALE